MSYEKAEILDVEEFINGLLLSNIYLPEEVIINLFIFASWEDLKSYRLVCRAWKRIIDSVVCFEKLKKHNLNILQHSFTCPISKLKSDSVPFYLYFAISNGAFGKSMLKNAFGSGDDPHICQREHSIWRDLLRRPRNQYITHCSDSNCPKFRHWGVVSWGGSGWIVEPEPVGTQPLPSHLPERSCFVTSYEWSRKEQLITLAQNGLGPKLMDEIQPHFEVSEWYARRWDCGIRYRLTVSLLNSEKDVVQELNEETGQDIVDDDWHQVCFTFKDYGPGVRYIMFSHSGTDTQFWAGHYGCKMAGGSVIASIPSTQFERSYDSSLYN